jgi:hypothetical protein
MDKEKFAEKCLEINEYLFKFIIKNCDPTGKDTAGQLGLIIATLMIRVEDIIKECPSPSLKSYFIKEIIEKLKKLEDDNDG